MTQMFDHELSPCKGWPSPYALDKQVALDLTVTYNSVAAETAADAGCVGHIDATSGLLKLGLPAITADANANRLAMPLFLFQNGDDYDVMSPSGNSAYGLVGMRSSDAASAAGPVTQKPVVGCVVATGGYELETTEYVSGTYAPNTALTSDAPAGTNPGKLRAATVTANRIAALQIVCGITSNDVNTPTSGLMQNDQTPGDTSKKRLRFWPVFLPVIA